MYYRVERKVVYFWTDFLFNSNSELNSIVMKAFIWCFRHWFLKTFALIQEQRTQRRCRTQVGPVETKGPKCFNEKSEIYYTRAVCNLEDIQISRKHNKIFAKLVMQGKLSVAIKLLDRGSSSGLLAPSTECFLHGPLDYIWPNIFDLMIIDEKRIYNAAMKTRGSASPSGMDAEI